MLAHVALQKLKILPSVLNELPQKERAFIYGSIMYQAEKDDKERKKLNNMV